METKIYPRYLFDVDFDTLPVPDEPDEDEIEQLAPPTFSEEDMLKEREKAWEAGRVEGIAQSNNGFEKQISEAINEIGQRFSALHQTQNETNEVIARSAVKVATAIAAKLLPEYARQNGLAEIESFAEQCMSNLFGEVELTIRVPEELAEELDDRLPPLAAKYGLKNGISIVATPGMGPSDCKIVWSDGGAERNSDALLNSMDDLVNRFLEHSREQQATESERPDATQYSSVEEAHSEEVDSVEPDPAASSPAPDTPPLETEPEKTAQIDLPEEHTNIDSSVVDEIPPAPESPAIPPETPNNQVSEADTGVEDASPALDIPVEAAAPPPVDNIAPAPALPGAIAGDPAGSDMPTAAPALPGAIAPGGHDSPSEPDDPTKT